MPMTTCFLRYKLDPDRLTEFEHYAKLWIHLVEKLGGTHHGYLMPSEGESRSNRWRRTSNTESRLQPIRSAWPPWTIIERQNASSATSARSFAPSFDEPIDGAMLGKA
jgi:hypothetical protein